MQIMVVSHQHRLRKRFSSSGKCNYQRANRTTHHLCCQFVCSEINHFCQCKLVISGSAISPSINILWKNVLCNVKGEHHIIYENAITYKHTPTLLLFPPNCLAISRWFHHLNIGLIIAPTELILKKCCFCTNSKCCEDFLTSTSQFLCLGKLASLNEEPP